MSFVTTIKQQFEANENVAYGKKQSDYLKNNFSFYGIQTQARRDILKKCTSIYKDEIKTNFRAICWQLYQFPHREMHHAAIDIFIKEIKNNYQIEDILLIEKLITTNSWWDSVDTLAKYAVGGYLDTFPEKNMKLSKHFPMLIICGSTERQLFFNWAIRKIQILSYYVPNVKNTNSLLNFSFKKLLVGHYANTVL